MLVRSRLSLVRPAVGWLAAPALALLVGCTGATPAAQTPAAAPAPASTVGATTTVISSSGPEGTAQELYDRGRMLLVQEKFAEAASTFDLVLRGDPEPKLAAQALMQGGTAAEGAGDREGALRRYRRLVEQYGQGELAKPAMLRQARVLIQLERWAELATAAEPIMARPDLTISEQVEAMGHRSLGLVESGQVDQATSIAERARTLMEKHHIGEVGRIPYEAALVFCALGEVRRAQSEKIVFEPMPENFGAAFEQRAAGLLEAQSAYTEAMRTTDPFWATWAGYRVGQLYQNLHHDVMVVKTPASLRTDKDRQLYEGALQLRYRILLEKGLKMMKSTVNMNDRVGETNVWGQRAREAIAQLESGIASANAVIKRVGVPEETLKIALDEMMKEQAKKKK